jgi:hypothetical protein
MNMSNRVNGTICSPLAELSLPVSVLGDTGAEINIIDEVVLQGLSKLGIAV